MRRTVAPLLIAALLSSAASAQASEGGDRGPNGVYARLATARAAHDVPGMAAVFDPKALLIDARSPAPVSGGELAARLAPQRDQLVNDRVAIETTYRVERRQHLGDGLAVDAGYMRQTLKRGDATPQVRYAKFLVTLKQGDDGVWRIVADAAMPSTAEAWEMLVPQPGLVFGG